MIAIIHAERENIHFLIFSLAVLFTLLGVSIFKYQENEQKAQALHDYQNVLAMEAQLDRFDQVIAAYDGIKVVPLAGETHD